MEAIEFEKIHMVMDLRLSYGYSAYELSFLLGRRDLYVRDVENPLHTLQYSVNENNYLRQVFNCSLKKLMPGKVEPVDYEIHINVTVDQDDLTTYQINRKLPNGALKHCYQFTEESKHTELPSKSNVTPVQTLKYITELFEGKFFTQPKTALMVFKDCQKEFGPAIRPLFVANALGFYTGKRKTPRLVTQRNEAGRMIYLKDTTEIPSRLKTTLLP